MRALITGGAGFIGSHLAETLIERGDDVTVIDDISTGSFNNIKHLTESVGTGAIELIENGSPAYRTVYAAKFVDTVYVLHSFTKTTNGVDKKAMKTAKGRYKLMEQEIRNIKKQAKKNPKKKKGKR